MNLLGGYTDYNDSYVVPLAIDYVVWIALYLISGPEVRLNSIYFDQSEIVPINHPLTKACT